MVKCRHDHSSAPSTSRPGDEAPGARAAHRPDRARRPTNRSSTRCRSSTTARAAARSARGWPLAAATWRLQDGDDTRLIRLESNITHLGRGLTSDLRFEHQHVSRTHALVVRHGRVVRVLDNRSTAGTYVNGRRVDRDQYPERGRDPGRPGRDAVRGDQMTPRRRCMVSPRPAPRSRPAQPAPRRARCDPSAPRVCRVRQSALGLKPLSGRRRGRSRGDAQW